MSDSSITLLLSSYVWWCWMSILVILTPTFRRDGHRRPRGLRRQQRPLLQQKHGYLRSALFSNCLRMALTLMLRTRDSNLGGHIVCSRICLEVCGGECAAKPLGSMLGLAPAPPPSLRALGWAGRPRIRVSRSRLAFLSLVSDQPAVCASLQSHVCPPEFLQVSKPAKSSAEGHVLATSPIRRGPPDCIRPR